MHLIGTIFIIVFQIEIAERTEKPAPDGWGTGEDGNVSNNPAEILSKGGLSPLGGPEHTSED